MNERYFGEKKKRPPVMAERKSQDVQEPRRKHGKMYAFIEENKNMEDLSLIVFSRMFSFPMIAVIICERRNQRGGHSHFMYELGRASKLTENWSITSEN